MEERMSVLAVHIVRIHDINNSEHKQHTKQSEELCVQQIQICYIRLLYLSISLCAMHLTCVLYKYDGFKNGECVCAALSYAIELVIHHAPISECIECCASFVSYILLSIVTSFVFYFYWSIWIQFNTTTLPMNEIVGTLLITHRRHNSVFSKCNWLENI